MLNFTHCLVAPRGLDTDDLKYMEEYDQRQVQRITSLRDQENEAAQVCIFFTNFNCQAFAKDVERSVITIEEKNKHEKDSIQANTKNAKRLDLDLDNAIIITKKQLKKRKENEKNEQPKKKIKIEEKKPVISSLVQYGSSDDEK